MRRRHVVLAAVAALVLVAAPAQARPKPLPPDPPHGGGPGPCGSLFGGAPASGLDRRFVSRDANPTNGQYHFTFELISTRPDGPSDVQDCVFADANGNRAFDNQEAVSTFKGNVTFSGGRATVTYLVIAASGQEVCGRANRAGTDGGSAYTDRSQAYLCNVVTGAATAPQATLSPLSLQWADAPVGTTSVAQRATLTNTGTANLVLTAFPRTTAAAFGISFTTCTVGGTGLAPGGSCVIDVTYTPPNKAGAAEFLEVDTNDPATTTARLSLVATYHVPTAVLTPTSLDFPDGTVGVKGDTKTITLSNTGNGNLVLASTPSVTGTGFTIESSTCPVGGSGIIPGGSCVIGVAYTPPDGTSHTGSLSIATNAPASPATAALSGSVTPAPVLPELALPALLPLSGVSLGGWRLLRRRRRPRSA